MLCSRRCPHKFLTILAPAVVFMVLGGTASAGAAPVPAPSTPSTVSSPPPAAGATLDAVTGALRTLAEQNEALAEQLNGAQIDLSAKQAAAARARTGASAAGRDLLDAKLRLNATALNQYRNGAAGGAASWLTAQSTDDYLTSAGALAFLAQRQSAEQRALGVASQQATASAAQARSAAEAAQRRADDLARRRADLAGRQAAYEKTLATLTAAQRTSYFGAPAPAPAPKSTSTSPSTPSATGGPVAAPNPNAQAAVTFAMAQLGKPYVFAAAGPVSFDCSGLTMAAWARAGVALPHLAQAQFAMGRHVSRADLQPGDLVFFYSDLHHVGLYIGDGKMVHAPTPGDVVKTADLSVFGSDYVGAVRLS